MMYEPINFKLTEFECKCGCGTNCISKELVRKLDMAREIAGVPFIINSGCRCEKHNKASGGTTESAHVEGLAVDIKATDSRTRYLIINALIAVGFNRIGIAKTFIHADIDGNKDPKVVWLY